MAPHAATARTGVASRPIPSLRLDWPRVAIWAVVFGGCVAFWVVVGLGLAALI